MKCVVCSSIIPKDDGKFYNGIVSTITASFGSDFDCDTFQIGICDTCIATSLLTDKLCYKDSELNKEDTIYYLIRSLLFKNRNEFPINYDTIVTSYDIIKVLGFFSNIFHFDYDDVNYSLIHNIADLTDCVKKLCQI